MKPEEPEEPEKPEVVPLAGVNLDDVNSVVLRRLIAEVRAEAVRPKGYDRVYNRHNRS